MNNATCDLSCIIKYQKTQSTLSNPLRIDNSRQDGFGSGHAKVDSHILNGILIPIES